MKIRTRLQIMTYTSAALIMVMAVLVYWSQQKLVAATKVSALANEIVISIFERTIQRNDYLGNGNQRSREQWLAKQRQVNYLIKKVSLIFDSAVGKEIMGSMLKDNDESTALFQQIVANREITSNGVRYRIRAQETENLLMSRLLPQTYNTFDNARRLQEAGRKLMTSTQRIATLISLSFFTSIALLVLIIAGPLGRIIDRGITNLQQGAATFGEGNLLHTIPLTGEDEFDDVAGAFNTMSGKLLQSHDSLEQEIDKRKKAGERIEHLNLELNSTVSQLQSANEELEAFAYSVSHDLRAPLRAIDGFSEALAEDYGDKLEVEGRTFLAEIGYGSRRMGQLIDGLLTLSRSTRGQMRRDRVDITAMADRIRAELERLEPRRLVDWQIETGLSGRGDERMIEVVMRNLIDNAWKYTGVTAEPFIRIYGENNDGVRFFCVADNGAGFDMAYTEKLFQPFQRLHRQDEFPGIGIGLTTAKRIVHRHGGMIHACGTVGKGATFRFSLPYGEDQLAV